MLLIALVFTGTIIISYLNIRHLFPETHGLPGRFLIRLDREADEISWVKSHIFAYEIKVR